MTRVYVGPWKLDHDPFDLPLGCNGVYGFSGRNKHTRAKEPVCRECKDSANHAGRERRRGQRPRRAPLFPCGTRAAAQRHRMAGEELDFPCKLAEAQYRNDGRTRLAWS